MNLETKEGAGRWQCQSKGKSTGMSVKEQQEDPPTMGKLTQAGRTQAGAGLACLEDTAGTTPLICAESPVGTASAIRESFTSTGHTAAI